MSKYVVLVMDELGVFEARGPFSSYEEAELYIDLLESDDGRFEIHAITPVE